MQTVTYHNITNATTHCTSDDRMNIERKRRVPTNGTCQFTNSSDHGCRPFDVSADNASTQTLGMAYVPGQKWSNPYECESGFTKGTIFPNLYKPLLLKGGNHCL